MATDASSNAGSPSKRAIKAIDATSVHRITSAQVVVDLQTGVKELVENSLDAGANNIEVRFKDYGLASFEVVDNGSGIAEDDYETVALNHHTSKLVNFDDLQTVTTFGFRGEALSSLCSLGKVVIQTASKNAPKGHQLDFDSQGKLISKKTISRHRGTTVQVSSLFSALPVRAKQFEKEHRKHFAQALTLLQAYALVSTDVRMTVSNQPKNKAKVNQFQTRGNAHVRQNFSEVFGPKALQTMVDLDLNIRVEPDATVIRSMGRAKGKGKAPAGGGEADDDQDLVTQVRVVGIISKPVHSQGRTSADRQFYFINGRPFNPSKAGKCFNDVYKTFNQQQYPGVVADFRLPPDAYDVNVDPNKRTVFLHSEAQLVDALRVALESAFEPYRSTFPMSQIALIKPTPLPTSTAAMFPHRPPPSPPPQKRRVPVVDEADDEEEEAGADEEPAKRPRLEENDTDDFFADEVAPSSTAPDVDARDALTELEEATRDAARLFAPDVDPTPDPELDGASSTTRSHAEPSSSSLAQRTSPPVKPDLRLAKPIQTTLDTSNASWNLQKARGKGKTGRAPVNKDKSLDALKKSLRGFASGSPRAEVEEVEDEEDEDQEPPTGDVFDASDRDSVQDEDEVDHIEDSQAKSASKARRRRRAPSLGLQIETPDLDERDGGGHASTSTSVGVSRSPSEPSEPDATMLEERQRNLRDLAAGPADPASRQRAYRDEIQAAQRIGEVRLPVSIDAIATAWEFLRSRERIGKGGPASPTKSVVAEGLEDAGLDRTEAEAQAALARSVDKADFARMQVVGQFNLGFIIVRKRAPAAMGKGGRKGKTKDTTADEVENDDLFIVDQHASDEKYNFERLQRDTKVSNQLLLHPRQLDLPAAEELVALENLDILSANGFGVHVQEDAPVGQRVKLVAQPVSGNTQWGVQDLEELLHLIQEAAPGTVPRPSKTRRHFAMRACRTSVMIGHSLTPAQMRSIVQHMGTMDQPWACPHGRPTMRWLASCSADDDLRHSLPNLGERLAQLP